MEKRRVERMNRDQRKSDKIRFVPPFLLLLSFIIYNSQSFVYKPSLSLKIVALFGTYH